MMHVLFLTGVTLVIGVITWLEWSSLQTSAMKSVYLTIVISVFVLTIVITLRPDVPGPQQGIKVVFKPFVPPWARQ